MATKKKTPDAAEMAEAADTAPAEASAPDPSPAGREAPTDPKVIPNSTFAERAKARNKRVDRSNSISK